MHPDAVIAIAACANSQALTHKIFEGELGWLPWQRPGYDLGLKLEALSQSQPHLKGIILEGHGLFTWGDTAKSCYETTLAIIKRAEDWLAANTKQPAFGGAKSAPLPAHERARPGAALDASAARQDQPGRVQAGPLRRQRQRCSNSFAAPTCCRWPRWAPPAPTTSCAPRSAPSCIDFDPAYPDFDRLVAGLDEALAAYRADYLRLLRRAASATTARPCATPTPSST